MNPDTYWASKTDSTEYGVDVMNDSTMSTCFFLEGGGLWFGAGSQLQDDVTGQYYRENILAACYPL